MAKQSRDWQADVDAIRRILNSEWKPIAFPVPEDEYDSYIPGIRRVMRSRAGSEGLAQHLEKLEAIGMGLPANPERCQRVAKLLLDLMN